MQPSGCVLLARTAGVHPGSRTRQVVGSTTAGGAAPTASPPRRAMARALALLACALGDVAAAPSNSSAELRLPFGRQVTVAVVGNEFFDEHVTRMGGFGYTAKMFGDAVRAHPEMGVRVVFVMADTGQRLDALAGKRGDDTVVHGWPLVNMLTARTVHTPDRPIKDKRGGVGRPPKPPPPRTTKWARSYLLHRNIACYLYIDYRDDYLHTHAALPDVPIVLWAGDPRTEKQRANIERLKLPGESIKAQGTGTPDARRAVSLFREMRGRISLGVSWVPAMRDRAPEAYSLPPTTRMVELPFAVSTCAADGARLEPKPPGMEAPTPEVLFLARLDPYKRPWLLVELAKAFPHVRFYAAGKSHFVGPGSFSLPPPGEVPNLEFLGHVNSEAAKARMLSRAWFIVNLSVHEGIAISWLEALHCRTPILATVDPGGLISKYGVFTGEFAGDGMRGLPAIKRAFEKLLLNSTLRRELGVAGRKHVLETHNADRMLRQFVQLAREAGVGAARGPA